MIVRTCRSPKVDPRCGDLRLPSCLVLPYENIDLFWRYDALERKRTSKPREFFGRLKCC